MHGKLFSKLFQLSLLESLALLSMVSRSACGLVPGYRGTPLKKIARKVQLPSDFLFATVADLILTNLPHLSLIMNILDRDIVDCIKAMDLPLFPLNHKDQFVWRFSSTGRFSIRSAIKVVRNIPFSPKI